MASINSDLARERKNATFDPVLLTYYLYGGPEKTKRKCYLQNLAIQDIAKMNLRSTSLLSREEQYEQMQIKAAYLYQMEKALGLNTAEDKMHFSEAVMAGYPSPYLLHSTAFISTVNRLASMEQKAKWLPLMTNYRLLGTYAQTELGHGTFLRGMETTATYDPSKQEFDLHSPTVTSIKYWPGGLGRTVNSCVVMAQLISKGQNHGIHFFLVQIRDLDTHQPLPGITVGDIGNKFGFEQIDNGFVKFDHVGIPRENMLMRYAQILPDGTYIKAKNEKLTYGGMTSIRTHIVGNVARTLSMAVTIAVRYSAVRRQSEIEPGAGEVQVLDFQTQQQKLLPQIANAYAVSIAGKSIVNYQNKADIQVEKGNLEDLPLLHALSAGLKAYAAYLATAGTEVCRLSCGGHGYSQASRLPNLFANVSAACTYEGENTILLLHTARYLLKSYSDLAQGKPLPTAMNFLKITSASRSAIDAQLNQMDLVAAFEHRALGLVQRVADRIQHDINQGKSQKVSWNLHSVELVAAALAFVELYTVQVFAEALQLFQGKLKQVMETLWRLYVLNIICQTLGDFLQDGYLSGGQATLLQTRFLDLLSDLRPNAVALVDAFDFPDAVLDSALGRWDGQVYEALYKYSLQSKLNEKQVLDAYHKYQRPFMESQWAKYPKSLTVSRL